LVGLPAITPVAVLFNYSNKLNRLENFFTTRVPVLETFCFRSSIPLAVVLSSHFWSLRDSLWTYLLFILTYCFQRNVSGRIYSRISSTRILNNGTRSSNRVAICKVLEAVVVTCSGKEEENGES